MAEGEIVADGPTAEVIVASPAFAPQVAKILAPLPCLTVDQLPAPRCPLGAGDVTVAAIARRAAGAVRDPAAADRRDHRGRPSFVGCVAFVWPFVVAPGQVRQPLQPRR